VYELKVTAVVLCGGKGTRMAAGINKVYLHIKDKPMVYYSLKAFEKCELINDIVVVVPENEREYFTRSVIERYNFRKIKKIVEGGSTRQESSFNGVREADGDVIVIHDGARPL